MGESDGKCEQELPQPAFMYCKEWLCGISTFLRNETGHWQIKFLMIRAKKKIIPTTDSGWEHKLAHIINNASFWWYTVINHCRMLVLQNCRLCVGETFCLIWFKLVRLHVVWGEIKLILIPYYCHVILMCLNALFQHLTFFYQQTANKQTLCMLNIKTLVVFVFP